MAVSFAQDIRPLFTDMDIARMRVAGVLLDDFEYMRDPADAQKVLDAVSTGAMPPQSSGEPPWPPYNVQFFRDWMGAGCMPGRRRTAKATAGSSRSGTRTATAVTRTGFLRH
jgi:hypothetical protein